MTRLLQPPSAATLDRVDYLSNTSGLDYDALMSENKPGRDNWRKLFDAIHRIERLRDDWDDDGAVAPPQRLVTSAHQLLDWLRERQMPAPSRVGAGPNGTILVEWQDGLNYFEIEICAPYRLEWMLALRGEKALHGTELDEKVLQCLLSF